MIFSNDYPPPHVHAIGRGGALARFTLNCPDGPVTLAGQTGFRAADIGEIGAAVAAQLPAICEKWRTLHG